MVEQLVLCPLCNKKVPFLSINKHLDLGCSKKLEISSNSDNTTGTPTHTMLKNTNNSNIKNTLAPSKQSNLINFFSQNSKKLNNSEPSVSKSERITILDGEEEDGGKNDDVDGDDNEKKEKDLISVDVTDHEEAHHATKNYTDENTKRKLDQTDIEEKDNENRKKYLNKISHLPLSEKIRPSTLSEYVGQDHLLDSSDGILYKFLISNRIPSMILWGPPGVGKTTLARLIVKFTNNYTSATATKNKYTLIETSATVATVQELRKIFEKAHKNYILTKYTTVLFIDEIHRFTKSQQDVLLPYIENGDIILVGCTTENPSFQLNNALLSRVQVFTLNKMTQENMFKVLESGIKMLNNYRSPAEQLKFEDNVLEYICKLSNGDTRRSLNILELVCTNVQVDPTKSITLEETQNILNNKQNIFYYDAKGDNHYDTISAFHKSIRGGDANASLYYLAKMLTSGEDPLYIARRMIRIASEDIGLINSKMLPLAVAAHDAVMKVGLPEADLCLAQCCVELAKSPKSVKLYRAWNNIKSSLRENKYELASSEIPLHLRNAPTKLMADLGYKKDYKYNPDYVNGECDQTYFPEKVLQNIGLNKAELNFLENAPDLGNIVDSDKH
ncbi:related to DNA-dependent ATPase MGS1 [Saccharomycodes ludwigii]|uniref:Related to DNA-dependent ATPase MGS1 n=1 Tax=Saccharomycodes ludwigii TaxID=36035 RepID=A0A376B550_9ASCO|nr:hypothetical protein SCDLUD_003019 [Saccharomycodes ludwigii]KAH3901523.1 hypothetical protein SCDLUD_003019 [Saccharomycodes ludwigii]SSD59783.1 related to DNA-dependent ATPase MGS1 [Saccharomycodes ludwigii]